MATINRMHNTLIWLSRGDAVVTQTEGLGSRFRQKTSSGVQRRAIIGMLVNLIAIEGAPEILQLPSWLEQCL